MSVLFELFSRNVEGVGGIADYTHAVLLAESRLDSLGLAERLVPGTTTGRFGDRFTWQVVVAPAGAVHANAQNRSAVSPYRVQVTVSWRGRSDARSVSLESLRLGAAQ